MFGIDILFVDNWDVWLCFDVSKKKIINKFWREESLLVYKKKKKENL